MQVKIMAWWQNDLILSSFEVYKGAKLLEKPSIPAS